MADVHAADCVLQAKKEQSQMAGPSSAPAAGKTEKRRPHSAVEGRSLLKRQDRSARSRSVIRGTPRLRSTRLHQALQTSGSSSSHPSRFGEEDGDVTWTSAQMESLLRSLPASSAVRKQHAVSPVLQDAFVPYIDSCGMCLNYKERSYNSVRATPARPCLDSATTADNPLPLVSTMAPAEDVFSSLCQVIFSSTDSLAAEDAAPQFAEELWWDLRQKARGERSEQLVRKWFERLQLFVSAPIDRFPVAEAFAQYEAFYPRPAPTSTGGELPRTPCGSRAEMKQLPHEILVMVYQNLDLYNLLVLGEMSSMARRRVIELLDAVALEEINRKYPWLLPHTDAEKTWFQQETDWASSWRHDGCPPVSTFAWSPHEDLSGADVWPDGVEQYNIGQPERKISSPLLGFHGGRLRRGTGDSISSLTSDTSNEDAFPWYAYLRVCLDDACWSMRARRRAFSA